MRNVCLGLILLLSAGLSSCDYVEEPYFEENEGGGEIVENSKKVVIMDFTGHTCKSCPKAHRTIHMIKEVYGDQVIPLAFHLGYFAQPRNDGLYETDYRTPEGEVLEEYYDFVSFPAGWVNRMGKDDLIPYPSWAAETADYLSQQATIVLEVDPEYDSVKQVARVSVYIRNNGYSGKALRLAVYLTESGLISYQKDEDAHPMDVPDYQHNNVFRSALGSVWGETLSLSAIAGNGLNFVGEIPMEADWVVENCSLVLFAYDPASMEIVQAEGVPLLLTP